MPRRVRKRVAASHALFIFEVGDWEPMYAFAVNGSRFDDGAFSEIHALHIDTTCRYPKELASRTAHFDLYGDRDVLAPPEWQRDHEWRPSNVAHLELPRSGGRCYARLPQDGITAIMIGLAHERLRYVSLHGPPLKRGSSLCWSIDFSRSQALEDD